MLSGEFARIVRDLSALGESVKIDVSRDDVRSSAEGEAANGNKDDEAKPDEDDRGEDSESNTKKGRRHPLRLCLLWLTVLSPI